VTTKKNIILVFLGNYNFDARCINMIDSLISANYSVSIIYVKQTNESLISNEKIKLYSLNIPKRGFGKYWAFHLGVKKILKQSTHNIIVACDLFSLAAISAFKKESQLIYDCREIYSELFAHMNKPFYRFIWKKYEKKYISNMHDVLFTAPTDLDFIKRLYPELYLQTRLHLIYNFPNYCKYEKSDLLQKKLGLKKSTKIILYQGVMQKGRGVEVLIKSINDINNAVAVFLGGGESLQYFKNLVERLELQHKCYFINRVPYSKMLQYTCSADLGWAVINPNSISNQFALPNKLFEYILMGLPVLVSKLINISSLLGKRDFITVVDFHDIENIKLKTNLVLSRQHDNKNIHKIAKTFTWQSQSNEFIKILKD